MPATGSELLALALALEVEASSDEEAVAALVAAADASPTALMGAYAYALCLAKDMPYDTSNDRTLGLLTTALQQAVREHGEHGRGDAALLEHIVEVSGAAPLSAAAVASRAAALQADLDKLRPPGDEGETAGGGDGGEPG